MLRFDWQVQRDLRSLRNNLKHDQLESRRMSADEKIDEAYERAEGRMVDLRMTSQEVCDKAGVAYPTYWRAKTGVTKRRGPRTKTLRRIEATLDNLEKDEQ